jgi:hypothetical protein
VFGAHHFPFLAEMPGVRIEIRKEEGFSRYIRESPGAKVEKVISVTEGDLVINPVEPVHYPKEVTPYLEVHFRPIVIAPVSVKTIYLRFPLEIGVMLRSDDEYDLLDLFSGNPLKYSLYGPPDGGVVTRWCESPIMQAIPPEEPTDTGILELSIENQSHDWIEVSRTILDSAFMHIFYGKFVSMAAEMEVFSTQVAETRVMKKPLGPGQSLSIPVYSAKKVFFAEIVAQTLPFYSAGRALVSERKGFLMEYGLGDSDGGS